MEEPDDRGVRARPWQQGETREYLSAKGRRYRVTLCLWERTKYMKGAAGTFGLVFETMDGRWVGVSGVSYKSVPNEMSPSAMEYHLDRAFRRG